MPTARIASVALASLLVPLVFMTAGCGYRPAVDHGGHGMAFDVRLEDTPGTTQPVARYAILEYRDSRKVPQLFGSTTVGYGPARVTLRDTPRFSVCIPRLHDSANVYIWDRGYTEFGRRYESFRFFAFLPGYHGISVLPEGDYDPTDSSHDSREMNKPLVTGWFLADKREDQSAQSPQERTVPTKLIFMALSDKPLTESQVNTAHFVKFDLEDVAELITRRLLDSTDPAARKIVYDALYQERQWAVTHLRAVVALEKMTEFEKETADPLRIIQRWAGVGN